MTSAPQPMALGDDAARNLANTTKSVPQMEVISPRWLVHLLNWMPVEAGIYRRNRVTHGGGELRRLRLEQRRPAPATRRRDPGAAPHPAGCDRRLTSTVQMLVTRGRRLGVTLPV